MLNLTEFTKPQVKIRVKQQVFFYPYMGENIKSFKRKSPSQIKHSLITLQKKKIALQHLHLHMIFHKF